MTGPKHEIAYLRSNGFAILLRVQDALRKRSARA